MCVCVCVCVCVYVQYIDFINILTSAGLISNMEVLIASHSCPLELYCLPPSYHFIFITDHRYSSGFCKSFILKEFTGKLKYMRSNIIVHKFTLYFKTPRLGLVQCIESYVHKIAIISTVQFNSFIDFELSNNNLVDNSNPYYHTTASWIG